MKANLNFLTFKTEASTPEIVAVSWNKVTYVGSLLKTIPKTINAIIDKKVKVASYHLKDVTNFFMNRLYIKDG